MEKLSKKQLKNISESLGAFYCGGNVYNHENITYYLEHKQLDELKKYISEYNNVKGLVEFLDNLLIGGVELYNIWSNQIAYSAGVYGNNGQLRQYKVINRATDEIIKEFYTYYC